MEEREKDDLLAGLNPVQKTAAAHLDGPLLIHAGAGSGKTRVLTHRVAHLIQSAGVKPWEILAVTFTNKAAAEMKERIQALVGDLPKHDIWIGTFHSISARILRVDADKIGYQSNFLIFDRDDQIRAIKSVLKEFHIADKEYTPDRIHNSISKAKNAFMSAGDFQKQANSAFEETVALVYAQYQKQLKQNNAMDFDDLLVNPIYLFEAEPAVLQRYQKRFRYILVDEYQDTNRTQYLFLNKLASLHKNLCVVGDDDQSIYRWRGADVKNILNIEKDYPGCAIFRLDQNYRSTKNILDAANSVVKNNVTRREKALWTDNERGDKVVLAELPDHLSEAMFVVVSVKKELQQHAGNFSDFVVLYRTNAQSRVLEDAFRNAGIPYNIVGGLRFYERKEIKDILAYLRLICNPSDFISFKRVINFPLRGIGESSVKKIEAFANEQQISRLAAAGRAEEITEISPRIRENFRKFHAMIEKYASLKDQFSAGELARVVVDEIGILRNLKEIGTEEAFIRSENIKELLSAIVNFGQRNAEGGLEQFLEEVALVADVDSWDDRTNAVTLMTLHSAKGLEFPVVFVTGLEEGLFPLTRTFISDEELEEERRLFYVGATRAERKLHLSWAATRFRFGEHFQNLPSRFLGEIDEKLLERKSANISAGTRRGLTSSRRNQRNRDEDRMPAYEDFSQDGTELYLGCEVKHATFGLGKVIRKDGGGETMKITVRFYEAGEKRLLVKYANLEVIA